MSTETIARFIGRNKITARFERIPERPDGNSLWDASASHWHVILSRSRQRSRMDVTYSMGSVHSGEPKLSNVIDSLAMDCSSVEDASNFEDWCSIFGYDTDSRRAESTYRAILAEREKLRLFLGEVEYRNLLFNVERE